MRAWQEAPREPPGNYVLRARIVTAYGSEDQFKTNVLSDVLFTEPARELTRLHVKAKHAA